MRHLVPIAVIFATAIGLAGCQTTSVPDKTFSAERSVAVVDHGADLTPAQLSALADRTEREYRKLQVLFGAQVGRVRVNVRPKGVGRHFPPSAIRIPVTTIRKRTAITAHEITHLLTQGWASVVLKEGLAVWAQDRVGEQRGWPNYRMGIHRAAHAAITDPGSPVRSPAEAEGAFATAKIGQTVKRRAAYNVAGSWVSWLIQVRFRGDVAGFMKNLYRSGDCRRATGRSYADLEAAWRRFITRRARN